MGVFADFCCLCYPDWALFVLYLLLCEFIFLSKTILIVSSIIQYFYWMCMVICKILDDIFKWFNISYPYLFYCNETRAFVVILLKPELRNSLVENKQKRQKAFLPYFPFGRRYGGAFLAAHRNKLSRLATLWLAFLLFIFIIWNGASNSGSYTRFYIIGLFCRHGWAVTNSSMLDCHDYERVLMQSLFKDF